MSLCHVQRFASESLARMTAVLLTLVIAFVTLHGADGRRRQASISAQNEAPAPIRRAGSILAGTRTLTPADVAVIQEAVRLALAGKYVTQRLGADHGPPMPPALASRVDEYLMDERGRVRFHRYEMPATAGSRIPDTTVLEYSELPAVRCDDRTAYPDARLGFDYSRGSTGWRVSRAFLVAGDGSSQAQYPANTLLRLPASQALDAGTSVVGARPVRGVRYVDGPREDTVWLDPRSLLPLRQSFAITMDGRRAEAHAEYSYPPPRPLTRSEGVTPPDCL